MRWCRLHQRGWRIAVPNMLETRLEGQLFLLTRLLQEVLGTSQPRPIIRPSYLPTISEHKLTPSHRQLTSSSTSPVILSVTSLLRMQFLTQTPSQASTTHSQPTALQDHSVLSTHCLRPARFQHTSQSQITPKMVSHAVSSAVVVKRSRS